eukprot:TRINITY_DN11246_c0_g1_i1.p1 TRINITY_DN11246_c0_g1~~TRINITY_DN11246_c0_g1_i1.p1  ORF type:complete len:338 (+),score=117.86 TRINITY_DN11246_c0_g1_i1:43-1014(+)
MLDSSTIIPGPSPSQPSFSSSSDSTGTVPDPSSSSMPSSSPSSDSQPIPEDLAKLLEIGLAPHKVQVVPRDQSHASSSLGAHRIEDDVIPLSDEDKEDMRSLPRKDYMWTPEAEKSAYLGLVDLIYAYCYNHRTTMGESTVESGWTIAKVSPTLSALETFTSMHYTVRACMRRSLVYPLYRHWRLSCDVLQDTLCVLELGKRGVLRALLDIRRQLEKHDTKRYLNNLYVNDYCIWVQRIHRKNLKSLCKELKKHCSDKSAAQLKTDMGWDLAALEDFALEVGSDGMLEDTDEAAFQPEEDEDDETIIDAERYTRARGGGAGAS